MKRLYRIRVKDYDEATRRAIEGNLGEDMMSSEYERDIAESVEYDRKRAEKIGKIQEKALERKMAKEKAAREKAEREAAELAKYDWIPKYPLGCKIKNMFNSRKSARYDQYNNIYEMSVIGYDFDRHLYKTVEREFALKYNGESFKKVPLGDTFETHDERWMLASTYPARYDKEWFNEYITADARMEWLSLPQIVRDRCNATFEAIKKEHNRGI